jgi:hypothetical protein
MRKSFLISTTSLLFGLSVLASPEPAVTVQNPSDVVGTGTNAWAYLILEGEEYDSRTNEAPDIGFTRVDASGAIVSSLGNPILGTNTTASKKGALWTQTAFGRHIDKVTYQVQFATPGTYYLYMRFTMFESTGNETYLNEDSFFVPPDFDKDPQTEWPLSDETGQNGGYTEGCCDGGYLSIREDGVPVSHSEGTEEGRAFWEGNFHWNELSSSQFLNPETQGEPRVRHKYVVTENQVGKPLNWTVSYREGGTAIDLWLFSTNPNLIDEYTQEELDQLLVNPAPELAIVRSGDTVVISWPAAATGFVLESAGTLSPPGWTPVADPPVVSGDQNSLTVNLASGTRFYRLKGP